ncbi:MAG: hypothetical protein GY768_18760 [Planctomycetaceae bacterium]|nr:hypothetical protein [Planctomycetaceae bacterium]
MPDTRTNKLDITNWLRSRIASQLKVSPEYLNDEVPFLDLGIDSLSLVNLAGELAEILGRDVSADEVWENDSIRLLSRHLEDEILPKNRELDQTVNANPYLSLSATRTVVRPIQPDGNRPALFLGQSIVAGFIRYNPLLEHLSKSQPVYGLQIPEQNNQTIEKHATTLIDGLRSVQRKGPYYLCGFCFGGILMFEVARQLQQSGEKISLLALIDPPFPDQFKMESKLKQSVAFKSRLEQSLKLPIFLFHEAITNPKSLIGRLKRECGRVVYRIQRCFGTTPVSEAEFLAGIHFQQEELAANVEAVVAYKPQSIDGPMTLIHSREFAATHSIDKHYWKNLVDSGYEYLVIPGLHEDVLQGQSAQPIATLLRERLKDD